MILTRPPALWVALVAVLLAGLAGGCGVGSSTLSRSATPRQSLGQAPPNAGTISFTIYLPRLFPDDTLGLQAVPRQISADGSVPRSALESLIQGPTGDERADDLEYAFDRRTRIVDLQQDGGTVSVELDQGGLDRVHGRPYSELVYWSLVYTLTEAAGVTSVTLVQAGRPLTRLGDPPFQVPAMGVRQDAPAWARPRT